MIRECSLYLQQSTWKITPIFDWIKVILEPEGVSSTWSVHSCVQFNWCVNMYDILGWTQQYANSLILCLTP